MSDLPTKPPSAPSASSPADTAPKAPAPAKPPAMPRRPWQGKRDPASGGMVYKTGGMVWASRLLEHMMSPTYRSEEDAEPGTPSGSMSRVNDPPERK